MKNSPKIIGLIQALGLMLYVSLFVLGSRAVIGWLKLRFDVPGSESAIPMIAFLLAFVTSALICGTIVFGYPAYLFFQGKKEIAIPIVLWNTLWLIVVFALFIIGSILL